MKRAAIIAVSRTWIGTPFVHQGRVKGLGCDCVGIPLCVAEELGANDKDGQPMTSKMYASLFASARRQLCAPHVPEASRAEACQPYEGG